MFYKKHMFFCTNIKKDGSGCGALSSQDMQPFAKKHLQDTDNWGEGKVRVSKSGCLGRCELGPVCVVYPEASWYTYVDETDVTDIIDEHLVNGNIVSRLQV
jgi:(2Fe-2S) ferredoxin